MGTRFSSRGFAVVFGTLLVLAGKSEFTGWMQRVRWGRRATIGGLLWTVAPQVPFVLAGLIGLVSTAVFAVTVEEDYAG